MQERQHPEGVLRANKAGKIRKGPAYKRYKNRFLLEVNGLIESFIACAADEKVAGIEIIYSWE